MIELLFLDCSSLGAPRSKPCLVNRARSASFENSSNDDGDCSVSSLNSTPRSYSRPGSNQNLGNLVAVSIMLVASV